MKEIWKDIEGYEGLYQVSNQGRVKSLAREIIRNRGGTIYTLIQKERILRYSDNTRGYLVVDLIKEGRQMKHYIHRLVAKTFLPNPNNMPEVNHKDEDKLNNCVDNLEWCSSSYNLKYGTRGKRISASKISSHRCGGRSVKQMTLDGKEIARYDSVHFAEKATGINEASIYKVCKGTYDVVTAGGYRWSYVEEDP